MNEEIELPEHAHWAPIPLTEDPEVIRQQYAAAFASPDLDADASAAAIAGIAAQLRQPAEDGSVNLAAWARVATPNELDVRAFATLRVVPLESAATRDDVLAMLIEGQELFQPALVTDLQTASGEALSVQLRPLVLAEPGHSDVHQINAVLWLRPLHQALFMVSAYEIDLVEAVPAADLLDELAAGIVGMGP